MTPFDNDRCHRVAELLAINPEQAVRQAIARRFPGVEVIGRSVALQPLHGWSPASAVDVLRDALGTPDPISTAEVRPYCGRIDDLVAILDNLIARQLRSLYT